MTHFILEADWLLTKLSGSRFECMETKHPKAHLGLALEVHVLMAPQDFWLWERFDSVTEGTNSTALEQYCFPICPCNARAKRASAELDQVMSLHHKHCCALIVNNMSLKQEVK